MALHTILKAARPRARRGKRQESYATVTYDFDPEYALRAAAKRGLFPLYRPFSNRWAVRISEIETAVAQTRAGGDQ